ncbi:TetR/AcrR family transcriptional regulator [Pseudonocardia humida]|uniref:TetR/AcrR family transcriptional regulator n=1 Tax=Pseudonocardia humida TaxID=2800819 RepID=UPI003559307C
MGPPEPPRPLRRDAERNRRRILDAARALVAERGLDVSHDDVARAADVGVGTVYRRFPDKQDLFDELLAERVDDLVAMAERARGSADPWDGLRAFVIGNLERQADDPGLRELMSHARGSELARRGRRRMADAIGELVDRAHASGQLRADVDVGDIAVAEIMVAAIVDRAGGVEPRLWRRALAVVLDGLHEHGQTPLPGAAPAMATIERMGPRPGG